MRDEWPRVDEEYFELLRFGETLDYEFPSEISQNDILRLMVKTFKAESGQFCLHDSPQLTARKERTALFNLSWKFTDQYISYYHDLDPFIHIMPDVDAFRNVDLMPHPQWRNCEFNQDFIKPQKVQHLLVMRLRDSEKLIGHIGLFRPDSTPAFSQKDLYRAQYLASVFSQKVKQKQMVRQSKELELLLKQLKDVPAAGVTVLDSCLNPVYSNLQMADFENSFTAQISREQTGKLRPRLPDQVTAECLDLARSLLESNQPHFENRHIVLWQPQRQRVDVEILALPREQPLGEGNVPFYLLLIFNKTVHSEIATGVKSIAGFNFTPKEMEISEYICQGLTNKEISGKLFISLPTVATHVQHILHKAGISRRSQLIRQMLS